MVTFYCIRGAVLTRPLEFGRHGRSNSKLVLDSNLNLSLIFLTPSQLRLLFQLAASNCSTCSLLLTLTLCRNMWSTSVAPSRSTALASCRHLPSNLAVQRRRPRCGFKAFGLLVINLNYLSSARLLAHGLPVLASACLTSACLP